MTGCRLPMPAAAIVLAVAACTNTVPNPERVELHRSAPQTLVLRNEGSVPVVVAPQADDVEPLAIPPDGEDRLTVELASVADVAPAGDGTGARPVPGTERTLLAATDPAGYLVQADLDAVLRAGPAGAPPDAWRIAFAGCPGGGWAAAPAPPAEHVLDLSEPPLPGVPVRLCPQE